MSLHRRMSAPHTYAAFTRPSGVSAGSKCVSKYRGPDVQIGQHMNIYLEGVPVVRVRLCNLCACVRRPVSIYCVCMMRMWTEPWACAQERECWVCAGSGYTLRLSCCACGRSRVYVCRRASAVFVPMACVQFTAYVVVCFKPCMCAGMICVCGIHCSMMCDGRPRVHTCRSERVGCVNLVFVHSLRMMCVWSEPCTYMRRRKSALGCILV